MADNKTKDAMAESLKDLLQTKTLNQITVAEITAKCGMNRQSFYYHFKDVYYLAEYMFKNDIKNILDQNKDASWSDLVGQFMMYAVMNRDVILNTLAPVDSEVLIYNLQLEIKNVMNSVIGERQKKLGLTLSKETCDTIAEVYMYAISGELLNWFKSGMSLDVSEDRVKRMTFFFTDLFDVMLQKAAEKEKEGN